eukprot:TRINITY_DN63626_c0_g1_i1.p1 TRINITY_DN63626_c0_g1~~TRINITY_DN63626_c0_g1_i1.p1  ORF type:complete len:378 (+),score=57.03 TRINITY_DN63626_c0_g1_i1:109-1134(+)
MDDEKLLASDGKWHRNQRKTIALETSCYYTTHKDLPYGCQYIEAFKPGYQSDEQRQLEKFALLEFYKRCNGPNWRSSENWHIDLDPCWDYWYGVTCNEHGNVIRLELPDNRLSGELPAALSYLSFLLKLDLSSTQESYHMHANTNRNSLSGFVPSLSQWTRLEEIELSGNQFTKLPPDLYLNSRTLRSLSASHNELIDLPPNLHLFTQLHTLELDNNQIDDNFPEAFGSLTSARIVHLQYNKLKGEINEAIIGMNKVKVFDISHNPKLGGVLPEQIIVEWGDQDYLSILNTSLTGYISSLCLDVPFCWKFMYDTHKDLTWATAGDVPDIVSMTIDLAKSGR